MNLETLKKYWNELEHYKNGGSLLARIWITDNNDGDESYTIWYKVGCECWDINKVYNYTSDYHKVQIIINDEYSIYRKALAEGKTIQLNGTAVNGGYGETWNDCAKENLFIYGINTYRIKPDEPKFKVGDFVTPLNREINCSIWQIDNILSCNTLVSGNTMLDPRTIQLWTPVKGEWCWFWDKCTPHRPTLRQYDIFPEGYGEENMFHDSEQNHFDFCESFLNSRPSHLKDK